MLGFNVFEFLLSVFFGVMIIFLIVYHFFIDTKPTKQNPSKRD